MQTPSNQLPDTISSSKDIASEHEDNNPSILSLSHSQANDDKEKMTNATITNQATLKRERTTSQDRIEAEIEQIRKTSSYSSASTKLDDESPMVMNFSQRPFRMSSLSASYQSIHDEYNNNNNNSSNAYIPRTESASISSITNNNNGDLSKLPSLASMSDILPYSNNSNSNNNNTSYQGMMFSTNTMKDGFHPRTESISSLSTYSLIVDTPPTPILFSFGNPTNNNSSSASVATSLFSDTPFHLSSVSTSEINNNNNNLSFQSTTTNYPLSITPPLSQPSPSHHHQQQQQQQQKQQQTSANGNGDMKPKSKNKYVSLFLRPPLFFRSSKQRHTSENTIPVSALPTDADPLISSTNVNTNNKQLQQQQQQDIVQMQLSKGFDQVDSPSFHTSCDTPSSLASSTSASNNFQRRKSSAGSNKSPRLNTFEPNILPVQNSLENLAIEDIDSRKRRKQSNPTPVQMQLKSIESGSINDRLRLLQSLDPASNNGNSTQKTEYDDNLLDTFYQAIASHRNDAHYLVQFKTFSSLDKACYIAAKFNNIEIMKELIKRGGNINSCAPGSAGVTPLLIAAHHGHEDMVKLLCEAGADISAEKENGSNVMFSACKHGHLSILKLLHAFGATFANGFRRLDKMHAIHVACEKGHHEIVDYILSSMHGDVSVTLIDTRSTCLHLACAHNHVEVIRVLLSHGADVNARDSQGFTPISVCIQSGNLQLLGILLNAPVPVSVEQNGMESNSHLSQDFDLNQIPNSQNRSLSNTSFQVFSSHFHEFFCSKFTEVNENNLYNEELLIPPWFASREQQMDVIAKRIKQRTKDGNNALVAACKAGKSVLMIMYISRIVSNPRELLDGLTPMLHLAKYGRSESLLNYLAQKQRIHGKWDPEILLNEKSENGWTALHWASRGGHVNALETLISFLRECARYQLKNALRAAPQSPRMQANELDLLSLALRKLVDTELDNGMTPLYIASHHGHLNAVKLLVDQGNADITKGLADHDGMDEDEGGDNNNDNVLRDDQRNNINNNQNVANRINSPLFTAAKHGHVGIVQYFSEKLDRKLLMSRVRGMNIIHAACLHQQLNVLRFLVEVIGIDPSSHNECDFNGWLPLHISARVGSLNIIKYLLEVDKRTPIDVSLHSGNSNATANPNEQGFTALHIAISNGRLNIVKYLVRAGANTSILVRVGNIQRNIHELARLINRARVADWLEKSSNWNQLDLACEFGDVEKFVELARSDNAEELFRNSLNRADDLMPLHLRFGKLSLDSSFDSSSVKCNCSCENDLHEINNTILNIERGQVSKLRKCHAVDEYFENGDVDTVDNMQRAQNQQPLICKKMVLVVRKCMAPWTIANHFLYPRGVRDIALTMHLFNRRLYLSAQMQYSMEIENEQQLVKQTNQDNILPYLPQDVLEIILSFIGR